jgi:hypothetical protein
MIQHGVILFHTTSSVLRAEKLVKKKNLLVKLIPTPREFSSDCGIALRFDWTQQETVETLLEAAGIEIAAIYQLA